MKKYTKETLEVEQTQRANALIEATTCLVSLGPPNEDALEVVQACLDAWMASFDTVRAGEQYIIKSEPPRYQIVGYENGHLSTSYTLLPNQAESIQSLLRKTHGRALNPLECQLLAMKLNLRFQPNEQEYRIEAA